MEATIIPSPRSPSPTKSPHSPRSPLHTRSSRSRSRAKSTRSPSPTKSPHSPHSPLHTRSSRSRSPTKSPRSPCDKSSRSRSPTKSPRSPRDKSSRSRSPTPETRKSKDKARSDYRDVTDFLSFQEKFMRAEYNKHKEAKALIDRAVNAPTANFMMLERLGEIYVKCVGSFNNKTDALVGYAIRSFKLRALAASSFSSSLPSSSSSSSFSSPVVRPNSKGMVTRFVPRLIASDGVKVDKIDDKDWNLIKEIVTNQYHVPGDKSVRFYASSQFETAQCLNNTSMVMSCWLHWWIDVPDSKLSTNVFSLKAESVDRYYKVQVMPNYQNQTVHYSFNVEM